MGAFAGPDEGSYAGVMVAVMSTTSSLEVPTAPYEAADWLRARHQWVDQLASRIAGDAEDWLDELAGAVVDSVEHAQAWREYERWHREPMDEGAYVAWLDAGPSNTARGAAFAGMSAGEQRMVRLIATLCSRTRVPWSVGDVGFDERGAAVLDDWLQIVHSQLPDWLYPG